MKNEKKTAEFRIVREFDAPKELVFNAFSEEAALNDWWGPKETNNTVISLDFRKGGIFHYRMEKDGTVNYGRFLFSMIEPYTRLEFTNAFADKNGNVIPAPFDINLPKEIFYQMLFEEKEGRTILTMTGIPVNANEEEMNGFTSIDSGMQQGFKGTFDKLEAYLNGHKNN